MKKADKFYEKMVNTIEDEDLISPGDKILIGVSGGADSMALFHCLTLFSENNRIETGVAHLNHMLRGDESERDSMFTEMEVGKKGIPFFLKKEDVAEFQSVNGLSLEDAARKIRYKFFREISEKYGFNKIATAHHMDDNAELIIMNLVRGSGMAGLAGIPSKRLLDKSNNCGVEIIRPLINHLKTEITDWLTENNLEFITDSSNFDTTFFRNKIRRSVMPILASRSGRNTSEVISRAGKILRGENLWLAEITEDLFKKALIEKKDSEVILDIEIFNNFPHVAKRRVLRFAVESVKKDLRRISFFHSELIIENLEKKSSKNFRLDLPSKIMIIKENNLLHIRKENLPLRQINLSERANREYFYLHRLLENKSTEIEIKETGARLEFSIVNRSEVSFSSNCAYLDFENMSELIIVRNFLPGDRFCPQGMKGSQKLKKFFTNNKVSSIFKKVCPLVVSNGEIVWVAGYRISDKYKLKDSTRKILKIELFLA